ncbi:MAG: peptide ABC transporter substrate-binding protein [Planctomycetota bacterium]|nr:peptide ABC transporter substrate-binding protein [Planctomycetota bacterium]
MGPDRLRSLAVTGIIGAFLFLFFSASQQSFEPRADFAFCNQSEISSLDPHLASGIPEGRILRSLFEGLTRLDGKTLEALPGMATSWESDTDGLTWRFHLRSGSRWTNGDMVTAHDFVFSIRRLLDPRTAAPYAYMGWFINGGEALTSADPTDPQMDASKLPLGVHAISDTELEIRLDAPCTFLPRLLAFTPFLPVHPHSVQSHPDDWIHPDYLVTNGPFRLVDRRVRDRIRLKRFGGYWGQDEVYLETIDAYAADGETTQLNMYLTGQVDWVIKPPPSLYEEVLPRKDAHVGPQAGVTFLRFQVERPPFNNPSVRRALTLALDREALAQNVMRGGEVAIHSFVPGGIDEYSTAHLPSFDPHLARESLAEAGYPDGKGFPPFELLYPTNEITRDFCEAIAQQWQDELGIRAHPTNETWKVYLDSQTQGKYQVSWSAWIADYLDASSFLDIFTSQSSNNRTGWKNAVYDEWVDKANSEVTSRQRAAYHRRAEQILLTELPIAPVYQRVNVNLVHPRVAGFSDNLLDEHPLRDLRITAPPTPPGLNP